MGKLIVISAPSGAGKTSIVHYLLKELPNLCFSISATSRVKRDNEFDGKDYHFLGVEQFKQKIKEDAFLEWEEVYDNQYYGTLKSEIDRIWNIEKTVIFDVDVAGQRTSSIIETYAILSKNPSAKGPQGDSIYYPTVFFNQSEF